MFKKTILAVAVATLALSQVAKAQTNIQVFYDFGSDRQQVTTTIEGFYNDNWGNTFFFVDHDSTTSPMRVSRPFPALTWRWPAALISGIMCPF